MVSMSHASHTADDLHTVTGQVTTIIGERSFKLDGHRFTFSLSPTADRKLKLPKVGEEIEASCDGVNFVYSYRVIGEVDVSKDSTDNSGYRAPVQKLEYPIDIVTFRLDCVRVALVHTGDHWDIDSVLRDAEKIEAWCQRL